MRFELRTLASFATVLASLLAASCGEYVKYDGEGREQPGTTVTLDEATKEAYANSTRLSHVFFDAVLSNHTIESEDGNFVYFDYQSALDDAETRLLLSQYLAGLSFVSPDKLESREERLAFWFNAYNASVISGVLDEYAMDPSYSVENGGFEFFDRLTHELGGMTLSLNQLEHVLLRGDTTDEAFIGASDEQRTALMAAHEALWEGSPVDARLHVAVNCAALSCPDLRPEAFQGDRLEEQLEEATQRFANNPVKGAGPMGISQLFNWYAPDWELSFGSAVNFISTHREAGLDGVDLNRFIEYDWTLNAPPAPSD